MTSSPGVPGAPDRHCTGCGAPVVAGPGCRRPLDPPRFCPVCGRRLTVAVTPTRVQAWCRDHGPIMADYADHDAPVPDAPAGPLAG